MNSPKLKRMATLALISPLLGITIIHAQSTQFDYTYDQAGNRTQRNMVVLKVGEPDTEAEERQQTSNDTSGAEPLQLAEGSISVFPNPTRGLVQVEFTKENASLNRLRITDQTGRVMWDKKDLVGPQELNFSEFSSGLYFITVHRNGATHRFKVIKE